jgi:Ca2+-binding RTX toxin-like protein
VTDTATNTAAQATKTTADTAVTTANTALTTATTAKTAADTAKTTADALVVADGVAVTAATTAKATADANVTAANAVVTTDTAALNTAQTAAMTTGALSATATVDLGAGDDSLTLSNGFMAGATINGGDGTDTLKITSASYLTAAAYAADKLALVSNFEALTISDAMTTNTYDVSKIAGITSFTAGAGVAAGNTASVTNLAANSTVTMAGALGANTGTLQVALKTDTSADVVNLVLKPSYTDNNDTVVDARAFTETVIAQSVETLNINSTGLKATMTAVDGYKADLVTNTLVLADNALVTMNVTGDAALNFTSSAGQTKLATVDANANTGGLVFSGAAADIVNGVAMTITGSATAANTLTGTGLNDTIKGGAGVDNINGGAGNDTIDAGAGKDVVTGAAGADTITLGAANDTYVLTGTLGADSVLAKKDVVTDFVANTFGNGTGGAAGTGASNALAASFTGDVIDLRGYVSGPITAKLVIGVQANAADAQTFLQNNGANTTDNMGAALDSSTGFLYLDLNSDGTADSVIQLTGVTTLTAAAFLVA